MNLPGKQLAVIALMTLFSMPGVQAQDKPIEIGGRSKQQGRVQKLFGDVMQPERCALARCLVGNRLTDYRVCYFGNRKTYDGSQVCHIRPKHGE